MDDQMMTRLQETGIVAIIRGVEADKMMDLVQAMYDGGIRLVEVTLNTKDALTSIHQIASHFGDRMNIGAGTVLSAEDARKARQHGAQFLVTPHTGVDVIRFGVEAGLPVFAGAMTPTEIYNAYQAGASMVKVFPAGTLGAQYIKEVRGPLPHIPLMVVGGISLDNAQAYLDMGAVALGLGGGLFNKAEIEQGNFEDIEARSRSFIQLYRQHISR